MFEIEKQDQDQENKRRAAIQSSEATWDLYLKKYLPFIKEGVSFYRDRYSDFRKITLWKSKHHEITLTIRHLQAKDYRTYEYVEVNVKGKKESCEVWIEKGHGVLYDWQRDNLKPLKVDDSAFNTSWAKMGGTENLVDFESVFQEAFPVIRQEHMEFLEKQTDKAEKEKARVNLNLEFQ